MADMKLLANMILKMRSVTLDDTICGKSLQERDHFETLSGAIRSLTTIETGSIKAGLKLQIGYLLMKLIKITKGYYIQIGKVDESVEVDQFAAVLDLNWDYIFYEAQVECEQRRTTV